MVLSLVYNDTEMGYLLIQPCTLFQAPADTTTSGLFKDPILFNVCNHSAVSFILAFPENTMVEPHFPFHKRGTTSALIANGITVLNQH